MDRRIAAAPGAGQPGDAPAAPPGFALRLRLGRTAWGDAFLARSCHDGKEFLLTRLPGGAAGHAVFRLAAACCRIDHPNLVRSFWAGSSKSGDLLLLTELPGGRSLASILSARRRFEVLDAFRIAKDAALGIAELHRRGLGHGALSPRALVVTARGVTRVRGFGPDCGLWGAPRGFRSPEEAAGGAPAPASDVYALGRVLGAMLAGDPEGREAPPPDTPAAALALLDAATAPDPRDRPRDMASFAARCR